MKWFAWAPVVLLVVWKFMASVSKEDVFQVTKRQFGQNAARRLLEVLK